MGSFQQGSGHSGVRGRSGAPRLKPRGWELLETQNELYRTGESSNRCDFLQMGNWPSIYIYIFLMDWITTKSGIVLLVTWCIFLCRNLSGWTAGEHCAATWWEVTPKTSTSTSTSGSDTCEVSKKHPSLVTVLLEKRDGNPIWLICARVLLFLRKWVE